MGRAELGSQNYDSFGRLNGQPAGAMAVYLLPGANQLKASEAIYETMETAKELFPADVDYKIVYDTTPAVEASIESIVHTFIEAVILVTLVVFIFLQNLRATLIPLLTVPVSLIGTFIFFPMLGFSVNTLSMFGLVLAIGIVVDDAIVVVEAVMHHIEHGMSPEGGHDPGHEGGLGAGDRHRADPVGRVHPGGLRRRPDRADVPAVRAHDRDLGAALGLQRAVALAGARGHAAQARQAVEGPARRKFFGGFNKGFDCDDQGLRRRLAPARAARRSSRSCIVGVRRASAPASSASACRPASSPTRTRASSASPCSSRRGPRSSARARCSRRSRRSWAKTEGVESYQTIGGYGAVTSTYQPNFGTIFVRLQAVGGAQGPRRCTSSGIMAGLQAQARAHPRGGRLPLQHPDHLGLRRVGRLQLPAAGPQRHAERRRLGEQPRTFLDAARQRPELGNLFTSFDPNYPQVKVELDRDKARKLGVPVNEVFQAMAASLGGTYVNDFNRFGRLYRVYVQAEAESGASPRTSARSTCAARPRTR